MQFSFEIEAENRDVEGREAYVYVEGEEEVAEAFVDANFKGEEVVEVDTDIKGEAEGQVKIGTVIVT